MNVSNSKSVMRFSLRYSGCFAPSSAGKISMWPVCALEWRSCSALAAWHFSQRRVVPQFILYPMVFGPYSGSSVYPVQYFSVTFKGVFPAFTILGLHPSFGCTVFLYWIGGMLTLNLGLYLNRDEWLSQKDWDDFCKKARELKAQDLKEAK